MALEAPPAHISAAFDIDPDWPVRRTTGGLINDTFIVGDNRQEDGHQPLVVQRISRTYFTDPEAVMENLVRIIGHLDWKLKFGSDAGGSRWFPKLHPTAAGKHYLLDEEGHIWRALEYIPGQAPTSQLDETTMRSVAAMYGRFLDGLDDLGGPPLRPTVTWYRDLPQITKSFFDAVDDATPADRDSIAEFMPLVQGLIAFQQQTAHMVGEEGRRLRPVHNDTKLDNVLMHPSNGGIVAVIDLDVAMQGQAAHDFGDLLRSANQSGTDKDRPFDLDLFTWLAEGFVSGAGSSLSDAEVHALASAGPRICLELGLRYLTDVLVETPTLQPDPVIARAKAHRNLKLAEGMVRHHDALQALVTKICTDRPAIG